MKTRGRKVNPVLQKRYDKGYKDGVNQGFELGKKKVASDFKALLSERIESLGDVEGIGEKTIEKFKLHFLNK